MPSIKSVLTVGAIAVFASVHAQPVKNAPPIPWAEFVNPAAPIECQKTFSGPEAQEFVKVCAPSFGAIGGEATTPVYYDALFSQPFQDSYCTAECAVKVEILFAKFTETCGNTPLLNPERFGSDDGSWPALVPYQKLTSASSLQIAHYIRNIHCNQLENNAVCITQLWNAAKKVGKASLRSIATPEVICQVPVCAAKMIAAAEQSQALNPDFAELVVGPHIIAGKKALATCPPPAQHSCSA
ncbi:hypothetical protein DFS34DRAFT_614481 [Phlyctochytrium arcticum]|nr:hypothetical protein DFS34DRAFT_614481 [Phlyctochytrium arcticum]